MTRDDTRTRPPVPPTRRTQAGQAAGKRTRGAHAPRAGFLHPAGDQFSGETCPSAIEPDHSHAIGFTEFETKRTLPSPNPTFAPPVCRLRTEWIRCEVLTTHGRLFC